MPPALWRRKKLFEMHSTDGMGQRLLGARPGAFSRARAFSIALSLGCAIGCRVGTEREADGANFDASAAQASVKQAVAIALVDCGEL